MERRVIVTDRERIAILETQRAEDKKKLDSMDEKLDQLLALRNRGLGAFWLASALFGTGIIGVLGTFFDWFKHG